MPAELTSVRSAVDKAFGKQWNAEQRGAKSEKQITFNVQAPSSHRSKCKLTCTHIIEGEGEKISQGSTREQVIIYLVRWPTRVFYSKVA